MKFEAKSSSPGAIRRMTRKANKSRNLPGKAFRRRMLLGETMETLKLELGQKVGDAAAMESPNVLDCRVLLRRQGQSGTYLAGRETAGRVREQTVRQEARVLCCSGRVGPDPPPYCDRGNTLSMMYFIRGIC